MSWPESLPLIGLNPSARNRRPYVLPNPHQKAPTKRESVNEKLIRPCPRATSLCFPTYLPTANEPFGSPIRARVCGHARTRRIRRTRSWSWILEASFFSMFAMLSSCLNAKRETRVSRVSRDSGEMGRAKSYKPPYKATVDYQSYCQTQGP